MKQTKYVMSEGLAFAEKKDMEKLRRLSLKGWHVRNFKFMGYSLEKGPSSDFKYSIDYRSLKEEEREEYLDFFSSAGWTHVTTEGNTHLFRAAPGTPPIYSDRETAAEKHGELGSSVRWTVISFVIITALAWLGTLITTGAFQSTLTVIAVILTIFALPASWTVTAIYKNKWAEEGKRVLVNVTRTLPFLLLAGAIFLITADGVTSVFRLLAYMIVGAVAFPAAIWVVTSLYCRLGKAVS
ncbi:DUF2812 domain-containing protein [Evansella clarkii]|uniref:DUF2812 domain-containing protein n=1 Tax=Evansella clarkii TaxID=79879 RepID=UPI0009975069|nr:DUF2812 domain-containing protein [Evansella clarkii]